MNRRNLLSAAGLMTLLLLAACSSGGIGDILGGGSNNSYNISGTVESVDTSSRSILLSNVSGYTNMLSSGNTVRVYYDEGVPVTFNGQTYRPENLERGDQVSVRVDETGNNTLVAQSVTVLSDVSGGTSTGGTYNTSVTGTVQYVDTSRQTIQIDRGYGSLMTVEYGSNTPVYYSNQTYRPQDLERGDQVTVRYSDYGNGRYVAQDFTVTRSISGSSTTNPSSAYSTFRGTVQWIDESNRTMQLNSVSWISRFTGSTSGSSTITVRYDTNTSVDVQGRLYPVNNLERGDVVEVQARDLGGSYLLADRFTLIRNVRQ